MTHPRTDAELADLRNTLDRGDVFEGKIRGWVRTEEDGPSYLEAIDIDDVRALVARLDQERAKAIEECLEVLRIQRDIANAASLDKLLRSTGLDTQMIWASGVLSQAIDRITERVKP